MTPTETEVDGVKLSTMIPGIVRDVPSSLGLWLIAKGYAQPEMRVEIRRASNGSVDEPATSDDHHRRIGSERRKSRW